MKSIVTILVELDSDDCRLHNDSDMSDIYEFFWSIGEEDIQIADYSVSVETGKGRYFSELGEQSTIGGNYDERITTSKRMVIVI